MPSARDALAPSSRLLRSAAVAAALACTAVTSAVLPGAVAAADEVAGTTVVGELVQVWAEGEPGSHENVATEGPLSFVETPGGDAVRVPTEDVASLPPGATVSVTVGEEVEDGEEGVGSARTVLASALVAGETGTGTAPAGPGHEVTVVLVNPAGAPQDGTEVEDVVAAVNGPVADFWAEQTDGAITLGVTAAHGWTPTAAGCSDPTRLWDEAAAAVSFAPGPRKHLLLYVSSTAPGCASALAEVGRQVDTGGRSYVRDTVPSVIAHELGHNVGLGHSSGRQCDAAVEAGTCRTSAYRDYYDVMGVSWERMGSLNAAQAARLGVLPAPAVQSVPARGAATAVTIAPLAGDTGTRAVRLTDIDGVDYWLEYRTPVLRDRWLADGNRYGLDSGVLLRRAGTKLPDTSLLLDGTPSAAAGWNADLQSALPVGTAVPVSDGDFTVVVRSLSAAGAVVDVAPSPAPSAGPVVPDPSGGAPVRVLSGVAADATSGPAPVPAEVLAADDLVLPDVTQRRSSPVIESSAEATGSVPALPLVGAALVGGLVLTVRTVRRLRAR